MYIIYIYKMSKIVEFIIYNYTITLIINLSVVHYPAKAVGLIFKAVFQKNYKEMLTILTL